MAWYNWGSNKNKAPNTVEVDDNGRFYYYLKGLLEGNNIVKFSNANAQLFACSLSEIFTPLDIVADRVSSVPYILVDNNDKIIENIPKNVKNLLDRANATQSMTELIYNIQFNLMASGGVFIYPAMANNFKTKKVDYISNLFVLNPLNSMVKKKTTIPSNPFLIKSFDEVVDYVDVMYGTLVRILSEDLILHTKSNFNPSTEVFISPLLAAEKNINNLIAVYSARYKAYVSNGSAGILSRKQAEKGDESQFDADTREKMINELNATDGVVGHKNFIGLSAIPMEFIKTIGTIKELEPFTETFHDQVAIAGIFGVDKYLLPTTEGTTFANKQDAEKFLWQNKIIPSAKEMGVILTKALYLENMRFVPDFSNIEILQDDRKTKAEADLLELDLVQKLEEMKITDNEIIKKWRN